MTDSRTELAERVFAEIERRKLEPSAALMFAIALELWAEDLKDRSKGFVRAKVLIPESPATGHKETDVDGD